jgi:hypothetical protein
METKTGTVKKRITHGISFPTDAERQAAKKRARERRQSLSAYICTLIEADLRACGCELFANKSGQ